MRIDSFLKRNRLVLLQSAQLVARNVGYDGLVLTAKTIIATRTHAAKTR